MLMLFTGRTDVDYVRKELEALSLDFGSAMSSVCIHTDTETPFLMQRRPPGTWCILTAVPSFLASCSLPRFQGLGRNLRTQTVHLCGMRQVDPRINVTVAAWDLRFLVGHGRNGSW